MVKQAAASSEIEQRQHWMSVLARADAALLERYWNKCGVSTKTQIVRLRAPESGLVMVRGRAGGTGRRFNLGEMTVTRCSVTMPPGITGHAYVRGRSKRHAELAACFDALLQSPSRQHQLLQEVIEPLAAVQAEMAEKRARKAAATKVDFFTLVRGEDDAD